MASLDRSSNPKILLDDDEDFRNAFAALASAPLPMRSAYATQLRGTLRSELAAQAARRARPWWLAWAPQRAPQPRPAQSRPAFGGLRFAMAGVAALMIFLLAGVAVTQLDPRAGGQVASLSVSAGEIHIARPVRVFVDTGFMRSITVAAGEPVRLRPGDQLTSNPAADAEIALPDGSKMAVGPGAQLTIDELQARTASRPLVVAMHLERGEIRSQVEHLRADQDRFEVSAPNLVAQVRGTVFRIDVRSDRTRVSTERGLVRVNWNGQALDVAAGRELQVRLGESVPEVNVRPQSPQLSLELPNATTLRDEATDEAHVYTNQATIPWRIQTLPGVQVAFTVNGAEAQRVTADANGLAAAVFSPEAEGAYRVSAIMETALGERSLPSPEQVVVVDRTPPSLLLTSPTEPQVTTSSVTVAGRTEPGARLELNGEAVTVDTKGGFTQSLTLVPGSNVITLIAADPAGNSIAVQSVIVFESTVG